jgi:IS30 family transposase
MPDESKLLAQARSAPEEAPRSKLENYTAAIFELRRKRWSYEKIAHWLKEHGIEVAPSSIFRFCRVRKEAVAHPSAAPSEQSVDPALPISTQPETKPKRQYRFNLNI